MTPSPRPLKRAESSPPRAVERRAAQLAWDLPPAFVGQRSVSSVRDSPQCSQLGMGGALHLAQSSLSFASTMKTRSSGAAHLWQA